MPPVSCSFCDHKNPAGSKYCNECGSPLHLMPCRCGAVNNVTDTHCYRCGAALSGPRTPAPSIPPEAQPGDVDEELLRVLERQLEAPPAEHAAQREPRFDGNAPAPPLHFVELEQPQAPMSSPGSPSGTPAFAGNPPERRPGRRHGYTAAALVLAIVAAAAGVAAYDRYAPWPAFWSGAPRGPAAAAPSPANTVTAGTEAAVPSPRPEVASTPPPDPSRVDAPTTSPTARDVEPAAPIESRPAAGVAAPATPAVAPPASDPRCPPAVAAMALCERIAHADRR
jgi:hypothetical protein